MNPLEKFATVERQPGKFEGKDLKDAKEQTCTALWRAEGTVEGSKRRNFP